MPPLKIGMTVRSGGDPRFVEVHRAFHLAAGVDIVAAPGAQLDADWIIESDVDEFWWPRGGSLRELLGVVPEGYGAVAAVARSFVPIRDDGDPFYERMVYRYSSPVAVVDAAGAPLLPVRRSIRRTRDPSPRALRGWYPVEVLHVPVGAPETYGPAEVERGLAEGVLCEDTRLRDAIRTIEAGAELEFQRPSVVEDALFAADVAVLGDVDVIRTHERLDALEGRLALLESTLPARLERRLRALLGRRGAR